MFRRKKKRKNRSIIAILKAFTVSAIIRGLVTCRKKEISCQCFASIVTSFFEGRKKLAEERCYGETLGRYSFLLDTIYTRKPRMVTNGVPLCSLDFLPFLNLPTILLSYYSSISSNSNRFNKLLFFAIPILFLPRSTHPFINRANAVIHGRRSNETLAFLAPPLHYASSPRFLPGLGQRREKKFSRRVTLARPSFFHLHIPRPIARVREYTRSVFTSGSRATIERRKSARFRCNDSADIYIYIYISSFCRCRLDVLHERRGVNGDGTRMERERERRSCNHKTSPEAFVSQNNAL